MTARHPWNIPQTRGNDPWSESTDRDTVLHIAAPCLVGNHAKCRGIVRSLRGDRECECPLTDAHDHVHVYEDPPEDDLDDDYDIFDVPTFSRRPL